MTTTTDTTTTTKKLMTLSDPAKTTRFVEDMKNLARKDDVSGPVTVVLVPAIVGGDNATPAQTTTRHQVRGNLGRLLTYRVYPKIENQVGIRRTGSEAVEAPQELGGDWSGDLTKIAEEKLYCLVYGYLGDDLKERMADMFDKPGYTPCGSGMLRHIYGTIKLKDSRAQARASREEYQKHIATRLSANVDTAELDQYIDTAVRLNDRRSDKVPVEDVVEAIIYAFPPALFSKIDEKSEVSGTLDDLDAMRALWAGVLERHHQRESVDSERAMAARETNPQGQPAQVDRIDRLERTIEVLAAALTRRNDGGGGGGGEKQECCGRFHTGTAADCWVLHPDLVPQPRMSFMLRGIHASRAARKLPDLSEKYPPPARAARLIGFDCGDCDANAKPGENCGAELPLSPMGETDPSRDYRKPDAGADEQRVDAMAANVEALASALRRDDVRRVVFERNAGAGGRTRRTRRVVHDCPEVVRTERAKAAKGTTVGIGGLDVDSMASVTVSQHREAFEAGSLVPVTGKLLELADGSIIQATHIGTLHVRAKDAAGTWRDFKCPGAWLVPGLAMSLLSVRALKNLGWRAPCFDKLMVYDGDGNEYPIVDDAPSFTFEATIPHATTDEVIETIRRLIESAAQSAEVPSAEVLVAQTCDQPKSVAAKSVAPESAPSAEVQAAIDGAVGADAEEGVLGGIVYDTERCAVVAIARGRKTLPITKHSAAEAARLYHSMLGHVAPEQMHGILDADGSLTAEQKAKIKSGLRALDCDTCLLANAQKKPAPIANISEGKAVGDACGDLKGPLTECRLGPFKGARYAAGYKDLGGKYVAVYFLARKSDQLSSLRRFVRDMKALRPGWQLRTFRTDRGGEYVNAEMRDYCEREGVRHELAPPYNPNMTLFEPQWRSIGRIMRAGASESGLDASYWPYFALQAATVLNTFDRSGPGADAMSALEIMTGKPSKAVSALRPIGCRAFVLKNHRELLAAGSATMAERAWAGVNLGLAPNSPAYMIYVPDAMSAANNIRYSCDVDFKIDSFPTLCADRRDAEDLAQHAVPYPPADVFDPIVLPAGGTDDPEYEDHGGGGMDDLGGSGYSGSSRGASPAPSTISSGSGIGSPPGGSENEVNERSSDEDYAPGSASEGEGREVSPELRPADTLQPPYESSQAGQDQLSEWMLQDRRDRVGAVVELVKGEGVTDFVDISALCDEPAGTYILTQTEDGAMQLHARAETALATKVLSKTEALKVPEMPAAIGVEMNGLLNKHKAFILIPITDMPKGATLIPMKLILAVKTGANNEFVKAKARLVLRGDMMRAGRDYDPFSTTSPMLHYSSLRVLGGLGAKTGRPISASDAVMAYLNAMLPNPVYGRLPDQVREYNADGIELVAFITKALYGHASSGQAWFKEVSGHLTAPREAGGMGFTRLISDPCLYIWREGKKWAIIGLAVDNAIHLESDDEVHADVIQRLQAKYDWLEEGLISDVPSVLGAKIDQDITAGTVTISLEGYIEALGEEYNDVLQTRRVSTPATHELEQAVYDAVTARAAPDQRLLKFYQRLIGSCIFASIVSRPDISWAVGMLARAMAFPTEALRKHAIRMLSYLVQHKGLKWTASKSTYFSARTGTPMLRKDAEVGGLSCSFTIDEASSDADFAVGPSVSGYEVRFAGAAAAYGSQKQARTEISTTGTEIVAGSVAATIIMLLRNIFDECGFPQTQPTTLYMDNKGALALAQNPHSNHKTKHLARRHIYLRECVEHGEIAVKSVPTDFNVSDMFTKALEPKKFRLFRAAVMNLPIESLA